MPGKTGGLSNIQKRKIKVDLFCYRRGRAPARPVYYVLFFGLLIILLGFRDVIIFYQVSSQDLTPVFCFSTYKVTALSIKRINMKRIAF